jgi:hypothetical protein
MNQSESKRKFYSDPGELEQLRAQATAGWARVEYRERHRASMQQVQATPEWRAQNAAARRADWADPVVRAWRASRMRGTRRHTPHA